MGGGGRRWGEGAAEPSHGAAEPSHGSAGLLAWALGACPNRPGEQVWALCPQSFLKNILFCRGYSQGRRRVTDTSIALEPAAAASCCQRAQLPGTPTPPA